MPLPTKQDNPRGLHRKYNLQRTDGKPIPDSAEFFVLRLDDLTNDKRHLQACKDAIAAYAASIETHLPMLARDLRERYLSDEIVLEIEQCFTNGTRECLYIAVSKHLSFESIKKRALGRRSNTWGTMPSMVERRGFEKHITVREWDTKNEKPVEGGINFTIQWR